jgi:hypothetical protein
MPKLVYNIVIGILLALLVQSFCMGRQTRSELTRLQQASDETTLLIQDLSSNMPDYTDAFLRIEGNNLILADKINDLSLQVRDFYVPPEGSYDVSIEFDSTKIEEYNVLLAEYLEALNNPMSTTTDSLQREVLNFLYGMTETKVHVVNHGFTIEPGMSLALNTGGGLDIGLSSRVYYHNRFGVGVGLAYSTIADTANVGGGVYLDYRGFVKGLDNLSLGAGWNYYYPAMESKFTVGLRTYF